ncbi:MAG: hypothetical protein AB1645_09785 [Bacillota bacterium]
MKTCVRPSRSFQGRFLRILGPAVILVLLASACAPPVGAYRPARPWETDGDARLRPGAMVAAFVDRQAFTRLAEEPQALDFARPGLELSHLLVRVADLVPGGGLSASAAEVFDGPFLEAARWAERNLVDVHLAVGLQGEADGGLASGETRDAWLGDIEALLSQAPEAVTGLLIEVDALAPSGSAHEGYRAFLAELRAGIPRALDLGTTAPRWAWDGAAAETSWPTEAFALLEAADYVVVANHGYTGPFPKRPSYPVHGSLTRDMSEALAAVLGRRLVVAIPVGPEGGATTGGPIEETVATAVAGLARSAVLEDLGGVALCPVGRPDGAAPLPDQDRWEALRPIVTPRNPTFVRDLTETLGLVYIEWAAEAPDGGYVVAGQAADGEALLHKVDLEGRSLWTRTYGPGAVTHLVAARGGGYALAIAAPRDEPEANPPRVVRTDEQGLVLWSVPFLDCPADRYWPTALAETEDGGYLVVGTTVSGDWPKQRPEHAWVCRLDPEGRRLWERLFTDVPSSGFVAVSSLPGRGYLAAGAYDIGSDRLTGWTVLLDEQGDTLLSTTSRLSAHRSVQPSPDGGWVVARLTWVPEEEGGFEGYLAGVDADGHEAWSRVLGGPGLDEFRSVSPTADGGYILAGSTANPAATGRSRSSRFGLSMGTNYTAGWLLKTDAEGREVWSRRFGDPASTNDLLCAYETSDGGYLVLHKVTDWATLTVRFRLIKTDPRGRVAGP